MTLSKAEQLTLDLPHRPAYGREDFLIADSNEEAVKWVDVWPDWPSHCCLLYGEEGSGKTHLSYVWQDKADALRLPATDLEGANFDRLFERSKAVIIEDIQELIGDDLSETSLFHLYNSAKENQGYLFLTSNAVPSQFQFILPDLRSRLCSVPAIAIYAPDDILLQSIIIKTFADRQLDVSADVLNYIVPRVERSFKAVKQLVEKADKIALAKKKGVTIPIIRQVLEEL